MTFSLKAQLLALLIGFVFLSSCKKDEPEPSPVPDATSTAKFNFVMKAGGSPSAFAWDTIKFTNAAGNNYAVSSLNLFISGVKLYNSNGSVFSSAKVFYLDPEQASKSYFTLDNIPPGTYTHASFYVGLDSAQNQSLSLSPTIDNLNMAWPDAMGGGYHFIKLEGYYLDTAAVQLGYAIHLGRNENLVGVTINTPLNQNGNNIYNLEFNVNEIFANPYTYNLNFDNNYTMADSVAMNRIKTNMTDAFTLIQTN